MEEYDADINYHFVNFKNGNIEVTSDIDDQIDYLEPEERLAIILKMIKELYEQIYVDIGKYDEDDNEYDLICFTAEEIRDNLIQFIINMWYNKAAEKLKSFSVGELEFSLAIYKKIWNATLNEPVNMVIKLAHSDNVEIGENLTANAAFIQDTLEILMEGGMNKVETKKFLHQALTDMEKTLNHVIDDYEIESEN